MFLIIQPYALPSYVAFLGTLSLCSSLNVRRAVKNERNPQIPIRVIFIRWLQSAEQNILDRTEADIFQVESASNQTEYTLRMISIYF